MSRLGKRIFTLIEEINYGAGSTYEGQEDLWEISEVPFQVFFCVCVRT